MNDKGDCILLYLTFADIEPVKKMISNTLKLNQDFLQMHIEAYSQEGSISLEHVLNNQPIIHSTKGETQVLISWPIHEHDPSVTSLIF